MAPIIKISSWPLIFALKSVSLHKLWAILFLVVIAAQTFSKCVVVLCFKVNQQQIASTLCVNKAKPASGCAGKCHLKKQLQQEEQQQNTPYNGGGKEKFEVLLYTEKKADQLLNIGECIGQQLYPSYAAAISTGRLQAIFHPPQI